MLPSLIPPPPHTPLSSILNLLPSANIGQLTLQTLPKYQQYQLIGYPFASTLFFQLNDYEIRKGKKIGVTISYNNHRLFVGNIPKNRDRDELFEEFAKHARKLSQQLFTSPYIYAFHFVLEFIVV